MTMAARGIDIQGEIEDSIIVRTEHELKSANRPPRQNRRAIVIGQ